jgi:putative ABC transport system permease protein
MQQLRFNIAQALRTIRANLLRSIITILIITLGITALVGILTATDVMKAGVNNNFSSMGANSFEINNEIVHTSKKGLNFWASSMEVKNISYLEATEFKNRFDFPNTQIGLSVNATWDATISYEGKKTNPNVRVMGIDPAYTVIAQTEMAYGRNISAYEDANGSYVCILGYSVAKKIFTNPAKAIGEQVSVGANKFIVVGIAAEKGGSMMMNEDNMAFIPVVTERTIYGSSSSFVLTVKVGDVRLKKTAQEEAEGLFRTIRRQPLGTENNFSIKENNVMVEMLMNLVGGIGLAAMVIAIVTLLGSIIGLMNIMLVSVVERTREIGISKALGARSSVIRQQFLLESVIISLMGGALGIFLSLIIGNVMAASFKVGFVIPWLWIGLGFSICTVVGIISGIYPALKAARLNPIAALRVE